MFTEALFTVVKIRKQFKCPSQEWRKKMWYPYTMDYSWAIKKIKILPALTTQVDLDGIILSELSQMEKDTYHMISLLYGIYSKEKDQSQ